MRFTYSKYTFLPHPNITGKIAVFIALIFISLACRKEQAPLPISGFKWIAKTDGSGKVQFIATNTSSNSVLWNFGDSSTNAIGDSVWHTFKSTGSYWVTMSSQTSSGYEKSQKQITVSVYNTGAPTGTYFFKANVKTDNNLAAWNTDSGYNYLDSGANFIVVNYRNNKLKVKFNTASRTDTLVNFGLNKPDNLFSFTSANNINYQLNNTDTTGNGYVQITSTDETSISGTMYFKRKADTGPSILEISNASFRLRNR